MSLINSLKPILFSVVDTFGALVASKVSRLFSNLADNQTKINDRAISEQDLSDGIKDGKHLDITDLKTADYTIDVNDEYIRFSTASAHVATLPNSEVDMINPGKIFVISDETGTGTTHNITMLCQGDDLINGATSKTLNNNYGTRHVMLVDTNVYKIIGGVF